MCSSHLLHENIQHARYVHVTHTHTHTREARHLETKTVKLGQDLYWNLVS